MVNGTELLPTEVADMLEQMQQLIAAGQQGDSGHTDKILALVLTAMELPWEYHHFVLSPWYKHMGTCQPCLQACVDSEFCET